MKDVLEKQPVTQDSLGGESDERVERVMESFELHHVHLRDYVYRLTRNLAETDDILQDLWVLALRRIDIEQICSLPVLRRRAYFLVVDRYRMKKRRLEILTDELPEVPETASREISFSEADEMRFQARFWADLEGIALSEIQKSVIWSVARTGKTYSQVSVETGIPASTIGDWVLLGRKLILEYVNKS